MKKYSLRVLCIALVFAMMSGIIPLGISAAEEGSWIPIFNENFDNLTDNGWSSLNNGAVGTPSDSVLVLKTNGATAATAQKNMNLTGYDQFKISFNAKAASYTEGPSASATTALKIGLNGYRIMLYIEENDIYVSTSNSADGSHLALDSSVHNASEWQNYELICDRTTGVVDIYVDGGKVGSGAVQTHQWTSGSYLQFFCQATASTSGESYIDDLSVSAMVDGAYTGIYADDFNSLDNWSATSTMSVGTIQKGSSALALKTNGALVVGAENAIDLTSYDKFRISFDAKALSYTEGPGDCATVALKVGLAGSRIMFAVEEGYIQMSSTSGTWSTNIPLDSSINTSEWQNYAIEVDRATKAIDVYVNGEKVGSGAIQTHAYTTTAYVQFFCQGSATSSGEGYVDNLEVSYWQMSGLPTWETNSKLTVVRSANGFTVSWPAATDASSYDVTVGNASTVNVSATSYTVTGLELVAGGHTITVVAKNEKGTSTSTLTGSGNPQFDPEVHTMDNYKILKGNTSGGDGIYSHYRIPGIVVTKADTVIMYFEARLGLSDWADMDILAFRSTDGGNSFGEPIKIVDGVSLGATVNNPTMIVGNDNTIHLLYCVEYGVCAECDDAAYSSCEHGCGVFYCKSTDDGVTWSTPVNISNSTSPETRNVFAVGPGHGICLDDGTLIVTAWMVEKSRDMALDSHYPSEVVTLYSKDGGVTWQLGEKVPHGDNIYSPNETMLAKTSDGRIMLSIRNVNGGYRAVSWSNTGYSDWSTMKYDTTLVDPTCMGSLYAYDAAGYPYTILSSNCNHDSSRCNLTLRASLDDGASWETATVIESGLAGYSDIAVDSKGTIYVLYEIEAGLTVNLARLTYDALGISEDLINSDTVTGDGSSDIPVNGEYEGESEAQKVVSIDITWDSLSFEYNVTVEWDDVNHVNNESGSWSATPAKIILSNHSNQKVKADFKFVSNAVDGTIAEEITAKLAEGEAPSDEEWESASDKVSVTLVAASRDAEDNPVTPATAVSFKVTGGSLTADAEDGVAIGNITITLLGIG